VIVPPEEKVHLGSALMCARAIVRSRCISVSGLHADRCRRTQNFRTKFSLLIALWISGAKIRCKIDPCDLA
jgi:hypothetical protein